MCGPDPSPSTSVRRCGGSKAVATGPSRGPKSLQTLNAPAIRHRFIYSVLTNIGHNRMPGSCDQAGSKEGLICCARRRPGGRCRLTSLAGATLLLIPHACTTSTYSLTTPPTPMSLKRPMKSSRAPLPEIIQPIFSLIGRVFRRLSVKLHD